MIQQMREIEGVAGVHIMAIEWEEAVKPIVEGAGLYPRPEVMNEETVAEVRERAIRGVGGCLHVGMLVDGTDKRHIGVPTSGNATMAASLTHRLRRFPTHGIQM